MSGAAQPALQPRSLLVALALAWAGGCIAYTPFLTLLLPIRFTALAGADDAWWLARCATAGALAAATAGILWGWASDRWGGRRGWTAAGLVLTATACIGIVAAPTPGLLVAAVVAWQLALNMLIAPIAAYAADTIPDSQKGRLGGWLSLGPALAALSILGVALVPDRLDAQLATVMAIVAASLVPLLVRGAAAPLGRRVSGAAATPATHHSSTLVRLWLARLVVQVAEGLLFLFIYYFLREVSGGTLSLTRYALTNAMVQMAAIPVALALGRWSDRHGRRRQPLAAMILLMAAGLAGMAIVDSYGAIVACYGLVLVGSNSFLALHSAVAMQVLPDPARHGRDLGIFNLTNTLPSLTTPILAVMIVGRFGYDGLVGGLAVVMLLPALLIARARLD